MENVEQIIKDLQEDIVKTQDGHQQAESLSRLKEIALKYKGEDRVVSFDQIAADMASRPEELRIMSGWNDLDSILGGFRPQQLIVVSALTKSGKTSWLMDLTSRISSYSPLWFPFEESAEELVRKFVERGHEIPKAFSPQALRQGHLTMMQWIESKIVESIAKHGSRIVVIDQLDFIVPFSGDNHSLRVGEAMRSCKSLAKKWDVVVFLICHLVKARMDAQPTLEDLKGSSSIAQEADTVILLWRESNRINGQMVTTNNVNVSVQANRRTGSTGNVKMSYIDGRFLEKDWKGMDDGADDDFRGI